MKALSTIILLMMLASPGAFGQNFPVSGTLQLTSGQVPSLSGLSNPMQPALFYTLLNTDISKPVLQVRLSISVSGQSAAVRTNRAVFTPTPIVLQYGVPVTLTGADMREYFDVDHLDFFGITREEYLSRGQLPEGIYSLCVEAYEFVRFEEQAISNNACAAGMIVDHDPPVLTSLIGDHSIVAPQNYIFSWQPMHVGAFAVEYNLKIYEWIEDLTQDQILQNVPPVFQLTTGRTLYQYSIADPLLEDGKRYLIRVQARAVNGDAYFKNEGYSQPQELRLAEECGRGLPCDDGNPCTINDRWTSNCNCVGMPLPDSDGDGVCDEQDICPGGDDLLDEDQDCIPDACDECFVGQPCDDGNECTTNDTYQQIGESLSCDCVGVPSPDSDGDGVCDELDVCQGHNDNEDIDQDGYPDGCDDCSVGSPCDDGNPATTGDVYVWNSSYPTGVPLPAGVNPCECVGKEVPCDMDSDGDGVCDPWDECPGHDDNLDSDGDGVPNGCDKCNGHNDHEDDDGDGIPNGCDNRIDPPVECNSVLQLALTTAEEEIELCTFCAPLDLNMGPQGSVHDRYMIYTFTLRLPSGAIVTLNANTPGFRFPYCSLTCNGSPGTNPNTPNVSDLIEHLNLWLRINGFVGTASMTPNGSGPCGIQGPALMIQATNVTPVSMQFQQIVTGRFAKVEFVKRDCIVRTLRISRLNASVTDPCSEVSFLWSNGETSSSIIVLGNNYNYSVTVTCSDGCEYTLEDAFCISGTPCDDHDPCTINDTYTSSCFCTGTFAGDSDGDSVCDVLDQCPGENDLADADDDGVPDACDEDCNSVGQACNDGNPCTTDDTIDSNCNCVGVQGDEDRDGICDAMDQCPGHPDYEDFDLDGIPDGCDEPICGVDMDACKVFQIIAECPNIRVLSLEELIALSAWYIEMAESNPGAFVTNLDEIDDLEVETYLQQYAQATGDTMYSEINLDDLFEALGIDDPLNDTDGDGVVNLFDLCPEDAAAAAYTPGQSMPGCVYCASIYRLMKYHFVRDCDDGDPCTGFDQVNCNCECEGILTDQDEDGICDLDDPCPNGPNDVDTDGDGIPDACDPQPCVATGQSSHCEADNDPCTVGGIYTINPATGQCDCIEISLQVTSNCEGSGECPDGIWFMNTQTNECECIPASPFPDSDGDGVCDELDICNDGDDNADADGDGVPDACDLCELPGALGAACDDDSTCTIDDQLVILYNAAGEPYCACAGVYIDSDDDGVCDPEDMCPGFPDNEDYDNDGMPDGCDPPYFEIGCPSKLYVIEETPVQGFVLTYDDIEIQEEDIPVPLTVTVAYMYQGTGHLIEFNNLAISGFQIVNGKVEVYYQAPQIAEYLEDLTIMGAIYVYTLHFSEAQTCAMSLRYVGNDIILTPNDEGSAFGCPSATSWSPSQVFSNYNGQLSMIFFNAEGLSYDLNAAPESFILVATNPQGQSQTYTGSFTTMLPYSSSQIGFVTDIPFFNTANFQIALTLNTGTVCQYGLNNQIVLNCAVTDPVTGQTTSYYLGQPCDDGDQYTDHDSYQTNPATGECICKGVISHDEDGDGVHDELDQCPGHDDNEDVDPANGVPDGCECTDPVIAEAEVVNGSNVKITIEPNENYVSYNISYYNNDNPGQVFTATATENPLMLNNLPHNANYTITVSAVCGTSFPSGGVTTEVEIPFDEEAFYCGPKQDLDPGAQTLLGTLEPGDTILAGDFEVIITEVSGGINGVFSGTGYITVPFLNNVLINVIFSGATINEDYVLIGGFMQVTGAGSDILLDIFGEDFGDLLDDITGFLEEVDDVLATLEQILETFENIVNGLNSCEEFYAEVAGPGGGLTELLNTLQYLPQEEVAELEAALECCGDPNAVWADCQQQITAALDSIQAELEELYNADYQIVFEPGTTAKYGFDAYQYPALASNYATLAIGGQEYWVPWKASASAEKEPLLASKKGGGAFPTDVTFEFNPDDTETHVPDQNDKVKIEPLAEAQNGKVKTLLAVQRKIIPNEPEPEVHIAGKVQVVSYDQEIINVVLVPVADASGNSAFASGFDWSTALKNIFKQAVVDVNVTVAPLLTVSGFDGSIAAVPENTEASLSSEMQSVKLAYLESYSSSPNQYILFIVPDNDTEGPLGYMPVGQKYGYIYLQNHIAVAAAFQTDINTILSKTMAHELGHGAFQLSHTFKDYPALESGSSNNLMDYSAGTHLMKYQWDAIHEETEIEDEFINTEDSEANYINNMNLLADFKNEVDGTFTFLAISGKPITLPPMEGAKKTIQVGFNAGDEVGGPYGVNCFTAFDVLPFGTLRSFTIDSAGSKKSYILCLQCTTEAGFVGYTLVDDTPGCNPDVYIDEYSTSPNAAQYQKAIIGFPCYQNGSVFNVDTIPLAASLFPTPGTIGYKASGARVGGFEYAALQVTISKARHIETQIHPPLTPSAILFLQTAEQFAGCGSVNSLYAYVHAQQITIYPGFFNDCGGVERLAGELNQVVDVIINRYTDEFGVTISTGIENEIIKSGEYDFWKQNNGSIYKRYSQTVSRWTDDAFWNSFSLSADGASMLLDSFFVWKKDIACILRNLKIEHRIKALELFYYANLKGDRFYHYPYWTGENEEHLYIALLESTPEDQYMDILNALGADNYRLYNKASQDLYDYILNPSGIDEGHSEFISIITKMMFELQLAPKSTSQKIPINTHLSNTYTILPNYSSGLITLGIQIVVGQQYEGVDPLTGASIYSNVYDFPPNVSGNPYAWVTIKFLEDSGITGPDGKKITAGTELIVPFCYAEWIFRTHKEHQFNFTSRIIVNTVTIVVGIATAPAGGWALVLAVASTAYDAADMFMAVDEYNLKLKGSSVFDETTHQYWGIAGVAIGLPDLAKLLANAPGGLKAVCQNTKKTYNYLKTQFNSLPELRTATSELIALMKRQYEALSFSDMINPNVNIFNAYKNHLWAEIKALQLQNSLSADVPFMVALKKNTDNSYSANFVQGNLEVGTNVFKLGISANDVPRIEPDAARIFSGVPPSPNTTLQGEFENVWVKDIDGQEKLVNKLEVFYKTDAPNPGYYFRLGTILTGLSNNWPEFFTLFKNKGWLGLNEAQHAIEFENIFGVFAAKIQSYSSAKKNAILGALGTWNQVAKFSEFSSAVNSNAQIAALLKNNPSHTVNGWRLLREINISSANNPTLLERLITDFKDHSDMLALLEGTGQMQKWEVLNKITKESPYDLVQYNLAEWIEDLWLKSKADLTDPAQGTNQVKASFTGGDDIAHIDGSGVDITAYDNGPAQMRGEKVKEVSPDGKYALGCENGQCGIRAGACFVAGTPIHTPEGVKAIEDLKPGDEIIAFDNTKQDTVVSKVLQTVKKSWDRLVHIVVGADTVHASNTHPFFMPELGGYLPADSIRKGMKLLTLAGALLTVQHVFAQDTITEVYNFEVAEEHNYYVGTTGFLVHNTGIHCGFNGLAGFWDDAIDHIDTWPSIKQNALLGDIQNNPTLAQYFATFPETQAANQLDAVKAWDIMSANGNAQTVAVRTKVENIELLLGIESRFSHSGTPGLNGLQSVFSSRPVEAYGDLVEHLKQTDEFFDKADEFDIVSSNSGGETILSTQGGDPNLNGGNRRDIGFDDPQYNDGLSESEFDELVGLLDAPYVDNSKPGLQLVLGRDGVVTIGKQYTTKPGMLDVHVHGGYVNGEFRILIARENRTLRVSMTPYQFADLIRSNAAYNDVNCVRLFACYGDGGGQEIANLLGKPVITSTNKPINVNMSTGRMYMTAGTMVKYITQPTGFFPELTQLFGSWPLNKLEAFNADAVTGNALHAFLTGFNSADEQILAVRSWEALFNTTLRTDPIWVSRIKGWVNESISAVQDGNMVHLRDDLNNSNIIGTIRNDILLVTNHPENLSIDDFEGIPIGEVINGCQLYSDGSRMFFKRIPDLMGFSADEIEFLTLNSKAHCTHKHGPGVTDEALILRTENGVAPNGEYGNPVNGTRFYSNTDIKVCIAETGPGTSAFQANLNAAGDRSVITNYDMGYSIGEGYRIGGNSIEGGITSVTAVWWKDSTTGKWFLRTMYPVLQ